MSAVLADQVIAPSRPFGPRATPGRPGETGTRAHLRLVHDADAAPAPAGPLALTPRERLVVRTLVGAASVILAVLLGALIGLLLRPDAAVDTRSVTVDTGESLWSLAVAAAVPGQDVRDVVSEIVALNALETDTIVPGQELLVPVR
ncbi:MAG TPA: LysM peptidoglycan-binding domain-containing protein [Coriobacteriia bacterium]|nr:LysM peptidoglycan-binding domain-containing protein [Coriobacteriia bacterium]